MSDSNVSPGDVSVGDVRIFDTTLRDGEQAPGIALTKAEKVEIAEQLARLNVDILEAGFPISSPGEFEAVAEIASSVKGPVIAALARTATGDIERAAAAFACCGEVSGSPVWLPAAAGPGQPSLGRNGQPRAIAWPAGEGARDKALVVADIGFAEAIRVRRIEQRDAALERGAQHTHRAVVISIGLGREAHAADGNRARVDHRPLNRYVPGDSIVA